MTKSKRAIKARSKISLSVLTPLIILALAGALFLNWDKLIDKFGQTPDMNEQPNWEEKISILEKEIASHQIDTPEAVVPTKQESQVVVNSKPVDQSDEEAKELIQISEQISAFFNHLDKQEYIAAYQLQEDSKTHFNLALGKLFANPPIVTREVDDLFAILNNMSHFFRIIGKQDILLVKEILLREREDIEEVMALFYRWSEIGHQYEGEDAGISLPLINLYEYAGFFLNTLGGQSYLFRRESHIRMLVKYYAVLIIDRANKQKINKHGIDIRFSINSLMKEIEASQNLVYQNDYLERLYMLQSQYQPRHE